MSYQIVYLDVYGNAKILADEMRRIFPRGSAKWINLAKQELSSDAEVYLIVFEITQDAIPLKIMEALELLEGKTILCFASCSTPFLQRKENVERQLISFLPDECDYRGFFYCPGQIPDTVAAAMQDAFSERSESAQAILKGYQYAMNHPDAEDLRALRSFIEESGI